LAHGVAAPDVPLCSPARAWQAGRMQIPQIPPSVRTSAAGFAGALLGWVATIPGVHPIAAQVCGFLSFALLGGGLVLAADHRTVQRAHEAGRCVTCGRPNDAPPAGAPPGSV
jgi:hypothetical protein